MLSVSTSLGQTATASTYPVMPQTITLVQRALTPTTTPRTICTDTSQAPVPKKHSVFFVPQNTSDRSAQVDSGQRPEGFVPPLRGAPSQIPERLAGGFVAGVTGGPALGVLSSLPYDGCDGRAGARHAHLGSAGDRINVPGEGTVENGAGDPARRDWAMVLVMIVIIGLAVAILKFA